MSVYRIPELAKIIKNFRGFVQFSQVNLSSILPDVIDTIYRETNL
jgi:hypothetical protein